MNAYGRILDTGLLGTAGERDINGMRDLCRELGVGERRNLHRPRGAMSLRRS